MARKSRKQPEKPHRSIEQTLDLPEILSPGVPHIEMQGNREIIIDGCRGILEYDEDRIKLNAGSLVISFQGKPIPKTKPCSPARLWGLHLKIRRQAVCLF